MISKRRIARLNVLNGAAPIMALPAEIRSKIYAALAEIDQFKVDCFDEFVAVFNPYLDSAISSNPVIVALYKDINMPKNTHMPICDSYIYTCAKYGKNDIYCDKSCCNGQIKINVYSVIRHYDLFIQELNDKSDKEHIIAFKICLLYIKKFYEANIFTDICATTDKYLLTVATFIFTQFVGNYLASHIDATKLKFLILFIEYFGSKLVNGNNGRLHKNIQAVYMKDIAAIRRECYVDLLTDGHAKWLYNRLGARVLLELFREQVILDIS
jgi:hypothetical protein